MWPSFCEKEHNCLTVEAGTAYFVCLAASYVSVRFELSLILSN